jgi:hypothetical protein
MLSPALGSGYEGNERMVGLNPMEEFRKSAAVEPAANSVLASILPALSRILSEKKLF